MRHINYKTFFKKQRILMGKRSKDLSEIDKIIVMLANDISLLPANRDHPLSGNFSGFRECHIQPDWLLIYKKSESEDGKGILYLEATGTHADLF